MLDAKYLYFTSALLCLLYLIGFFKNGKAYKIFTIYIIGVLLMDFISSKLYSWFRIYNIFMNHFYDLFQFVILSYFFFLLSRYVFNPQMFFEYSLLETYLTTMPLIIYSSMHLYNNLGEKSEFYFINVGLLFYLFTSTFIFLLYKLITVFKFDEFNDIMIDINIILQYIKFGFFFY